MYMRIEFRLSLFSCINNDIMNFFSVEHNRLLNNLNSHLLIEKFLVFPAKKIVVQIISYVNSTSHELCLDFLFL